jgi:photosystem II stability/assembly factor-like uncharacterized protein
VGGIARTSDGGEHWKLIELSDEVLPDSVSATFRGRTFGLDFYSPRSGWVLGGEPYDVFCDADGDLATRLRGIILHTADGGQSWMRYRLGEDEYPVAVAATGTRSAIVVGHNGRYREEEYPSFILSTFNGGLTWTRQDFPTYVLSDIVFSDQRTGWVGGYGRQDGFLLRTRDVGRTWEQLQLGSGFVSLPVFLDHRLGVTCREVWATDRSITVPMMTTDGGQTWSEGEITGLLPEGLDSSSDPSRYAFVTPALRWALGNNHELWRWTPGGAPLSPVLVD